VLKLYSRAKAVLGQNDSFATQVVPQLPGHIKPASPVESAPMLQRSFRPQLIALLIFLHPNYFTFDYCVCCSFSYGTRHSTPDTDFKLMFGWTVQA